MAQQPARRGAPGYTPRTEMERAGFAEVDHVSPEEQVRRYLQGRQDIPTPPPNFAFAKTS